MFVLAALCVVPTEVRASIIPPVSEGVWSTEKVLPSAIEKGDFSQIRDMLLPDAVILSDDERLLRKGPEEIIPYLQQWYAKGNHVVETYPGYDSLIVLVTRDADRPWDKAYAMVVTCREGKIARIMMIPRNPTMR